MGKPGTGNAVSSRAEYIGAWKASEGTETSQYLEERKSTETPRVVASERGSSLNRLRASVQALRSRGRRTCLRELHLSAGVRNPFASRRSVEHRRHSG